MLLFRYFWTTVIIKLFKLHLHALNYESNTTI